MRRRRDEELYGAFDEQEDELSLEAILAEYGKGGRQPVLEEPSEGPPSQPEPVPEPESIPEPEPVQKEERVPGPEYESPAPDRVALKDIMSQTVDAVLEDEDDGVIAQPVPLRERLAAVLERFHRPAAEQRSIPLATASSFPPIKAEQRHADRLTLTLSSAVRNSVLSPHISRGRTARAHPS